MKDDSEYDSVTCPVDGCDYGGAIRSVAAHVSGTSDDRHSWDRLGYDGAREFVMREKRRQHDGVAPSSDLETDASSDADIGTSSNLDVGASADAETDAPDVSSEAPLDLEFARDAMVLFDVAHRYDVDSLDELDTFRLVNLYTLLSDLSRSADDARKRVRDALLDAVQDDREVASDFGSIRRYSYERRELKDDDVVVTELERAGIDPADVMRPDRKAVEDAVEAAGIDPAVVFDSTRRAGIRKATEDAEGREAAFEELDPAVRSLIDDR